MQIKLSSLLPLGIFVAILVVLSASSPNLHAQGESDEGSISIQRPTLRLGIRNTSRT